jgi:hypothetical protein
MGEATREAPAQAELRPPTSARAFRVILPCDVTPVYSPTWDTAFG